MQVVVTESIFSMDGRGGICGPGENETAASIFLLLD